MGDVRGHAGRNVVVGGATSGMAATATILATLGAHVTALDVRPHRGFRGPGEPRPAENVRIQKRGYSLHLMTVMRTVSGVSAHNAAETKSVPVSDEETPGTAADIRALAAQAEAEAAEAEALAA